MDNIQEYAFVNDNPIEDVNLNTSEIQINNGEYNIPVDPILEADKSIEDAGGSSLCGVFHTPNGSRYYIPDVPLMYKPVDGSIWDSYDEARAMYEVYADKAGFTVRKSVKKHNHGNISHRYHLCNKEGKPRTQKSEDTLLKDKDNIIDSSVEQNVKKSVRAKRNSSVKVTDCKARIKLKLIKGTNKYVLYGFEECHNHPLDEEEDKHLSCSQRQLEFEDQQFMLTVGMNNIGPTKAYRLLSFLKGGYDKVRGTVVDYKNFKRDVNIFIGDRDAQMLINKFAKRKLSNPEFLYEYKTEEDELIGLFWADETSKCNYTEFGDVLAFDATYRTNMYKMVFVPFTGVDHHNKCVTFGGGLLKYETKESYKWLLEAFLKAHTKQPTLVLTDQDPAMKDAISEVMDEATHRLCMWHIMRKLPKKVSSNLLENTYLRRRIHKIVWDVLLTTEKFESRWTSLIEELNLQDNSWLAAVFKIRDRWVPGYFYDLPMCCLMKTTSRAESSNVFFRIFVDPDHTLVQFMICFESAMEKQCHVHRVLDYQTKEVNPWFVTQLSIEEHASSVFTLAIFWKVQKDIYRSVWFCSQRVISSDDFREVYEIRDVNQKTKVVSRHQVVQDKADDSIVCSCNHFGRHGWLCRHRFCVFKSNQVEQIPQQYIKRRWSKDILPKHLLDKRHRYGMETCENTKLCTTIISNVELIVSRLRNDPEKLFEFAEKIRQIKANILKNPPVQPAHKNKEDAICEFLGVTIPDEVLVRPPKNVKTKGSGRPRKRFVAADEKQVQKRKRLMRLCKNCGVRQNTHDSRTCDKEKEKMLKSKQNQSHVGSSID